MPVANGLPEAIDLSHHINKVSKSRHPSPLKDLLGYMSNPGMLSLAGGLPHPSLFPFVELSADVYPASTFLNAGAPEIPDNLERLSIPKTAAGGKDLIHLDRTMQYASANGLPQLLSFAREFTSTILQPSYSNWEVLVHSGNTDAWSKVMGLLSEPGDYILVEEHTYPSAQAHWIPRGCKGVPLKMDGQGVLGSHLKEVLDGWETERPGKKKPNLLYLVPVASNPTGATMGLERKQEIYDVAVEHDIIIVEDDPYYSLQFDDYKPGVEPRATTDPAEYVKRLVPSFLKVDYQGRVIRLDTFSKTLAPGNRLGYFIANPVFTERLLRATEVETQTASGWSQAIIASLLQKWGQQGYLLWLSNLCEQYRVRRDWLYEAFDQSFDLVPASEVPELKEQGMLAYFKGTSKEARDKPIMNFITPTSGMFFFAKCYLTSHPSFASLKADSTISDPEEHLMQILWHLLIDAGVLIVPGSYYHPFEGLETLRGERGYGHFRFAFSTVMREECGVAIERYEKVMREAWKV